MFETYYHKEGTVGAAQYNAENYEIIMQALFGDISNDLTCKFDMLVTQGEEVPSVIYRYKDESTDQTLNAGDYMVCYSDQKYTAVSQSTFEANYTLQEPSDPEAEVNTAKIEQYETLISYLQEKLYNTQVPSTEPVAASNDNATFSDPEKDITLSSEAALTTTLSVTAKSISAKDLTIENTLAKLTATGPIFVNNFSTSGDLPKSTSNAGLSINTSGIVQITGGTWEQTGYNGIEVGLSNSSPYAVTIADMDFDTTFSNNAILVFSHAEGAIITIQNIHVKRCSNFLRLSNRLNKPCTVNIIDCVIDHWEETPDYAGMILLQDYTALDKNAAIADARFSADKLRINFINCYGPYGKIVAPENNADIFGSGIVDKQLMYIYCNGNALLKYADYAALYPTVTFA